MASCQNLAKWVSNELSAFKASRRLSHVLVRLTKPVAACSRRSARAKNNFGSKVYDARTLMTQKQALQGSHVRRLSRDAAGLGAEVN